MMSTVNWNPFVGSTYVSGTATRDFSSLLCICFANNCNNYSLITINTMMTVNHSLYFSLNGVT